MMCLDDFSCTDLKNKDPSLKSGEFTIRVDGQPKLVFCDMEDGEIGWTVLQRRGDFGNPPRYFLRKWQAYKNGFGELDEEFWIGLESMHQYEIKQHIFYFTFLCIKMSLLISQVVVVVDSLFTFTKYV
jgi:hypothetical protein